MLAIGSSVLILLSSVVFVEVLAGLERLTMARGSIGAEGALVELVERASLLVEDGAGVVEAVGFLAALTERGRNAIEVEVRESRDEERLRRIAER